MELLITTSRTNAGEIDAILNSFFRSPLECDFLAWLSTRICLPKKERPLARIGECHSFQTCRTDGFQQLQSSQQHAQLQLSCSDMKGNVSVSFNTNYMYTKPQEQMPLLVNLHESACRKFSILITIRG